MLIFHILGLHLSDSIAHYEVFGPFSFQIERGREERHHCTTPPSVELPLGALQGALTWYCGAQTHVLMHDKVCALLGELSPGLMGVLSARLCRGLKHKSVKYLS